MLAVIDLGSHIAWIGRARTWTRASCSQNPFSWPAQKLLPHSRQACGSGLQSSALISFLGWRDYDLSVDECPEKWFKWSRSFCVTIEARCGFYNPRTRGAGEFTDWSQIILFKETLSQQVLNEHPLRYFKDVVCLLWNTMTEMREVEPSQRTISSRHYLVEFPDHILWSFPSVLVSWARSFSCDCPTAECSSLLAWLTSELAYCSCPNVGPKFPSNWVGWSR